VRAEIEQDGLAGGNGFAHQVGKVFQRSGIEIKLAESRVDRRRRIVGRRGGRGAERGVGIPGVVEGEEHNQQAECFFNFFHPRAGLGQDGETGGGQRPRQGHAHAEQKRQRQGDANALRIQRAGKRQHGNQHRGDAGTGQQSGNPAHNEHGGQSRLSGEAGALAEAAEVELPDIEHRQGQREEQHGNRAVEHGRGVDGAEDGTRQHHHQPQCAIDQRHAEAIHQAEAEARGSRGIRAAGTDDGQVDGDHRQHAGREIEKEAADQDQEDGGQNAMAEVELAGIVEKQLPGGCLRRGRRSRIEKGQECGNLGVPYQAARFAAFFEPLAPIRVRGNRI